MSDIHNRLQKYLHTDPMWQRRGRSDYDLNPDMKPAPGEIGPLKESAVLVPLVERDDELHMLLTLRAEGMANHAGQVSFPGGRVDQADHDPVHTALRETYEEIGIAEDLIRIAGFLDPYETRTGYTIMPVVGLVTPSFDLTLNRAEVADVFEVPLSFLMDPANHHTHGREWRGAMRYFYAMPYQDCYIWGATAGMIKELYDRLYES